MLQLTRHYQMAAHRNHINTSLYCDITLTANAKSLKTFIKCTEENKFLQ